jgi:hypothetical protein
MQNKRCQTNPIAKKATPRFFTSLHPPPPVLLRRTRRPTHSPIIPGPDPIRARHKHLSRLLRLFLDIISQDLMAATPHERNKGDANYQRKAQENHVNRDRVIVKGFVCRCVEGGLGEVQKPRETNDQAVDFAKGGEAEDFGRVIAADGIRAVCKKKKKLQGSENLRNCGIV